MALSESATDASGAATDHSFHPLRVGRVRRETAEASSFVLDVPAALRHAFAYEAGQFCTFRVWVDGQPLVRCYSMCSSPVVDTELQVTVKRIPGGLVSNWMNDHLAPGDIVEVARPDRLLPPRSGTGGSGGVQCRERDHTRPLAGQDGAGHDVATRSPRLRQPGP